MRRRWLSGGCGECLPDPWRSPLVANRQVPERMYVCYSYERPMRGGWKDDHFPIILPCLHIMLAPNPATALNFVTVASFTEVCSCKSGISVSPREQRQLLKEEEVGHSY